MRWDSIRREPLSSAVKCVCIQIWGEGRRVFSGMKGNGSVLRRWKPILLLSCPGSFVWLNAVSVCAKSASGELRWTGFGHVAKQELHFPEFSFLHRLGLAQVPRDIC